MGAEFKTSNIWADIEMDLPEEIHRSPDRIQEFKNFLKTAYSEGKLTFSTERTTYSVNGEFYTDPRGFEHIRIDNNSQESIVEPPKTNLVLETDYEEYRIEYEYVETETLTKNGSYKELVEDTRWKLLLSELEEDIVIEEQS